MDNKQKAALQANLYRKALQELRDKHPDEFRQILAATQQEAGVFVRKRRTKSEMKADKLAEALRLIAEADLPQ